jgi:subtilase family serine protease
MLHRSGIKMKKLELFVATLACMIIFIMPAMAAWNYDGYEVKTMESGSIKGDVFVSYGDKSGIGSSPYTSNFNVPGGTEKNTRLYVGVWGGTETKTGTLSTTFNGNDLGTINIGGKVDTNPTYTTDTNVYGVGNGVWWASYNVTGEVTMGAANAATATTGGTIDGRVYAIMLVTVYSDPSEPEIQYWINEGNVNLHYNSASYPYVQDKTFVWFNGTAITPVSARMSTVYLTGSKGEPDYLYFNPPVASDSPYSNMAWNISAYRTNQLDGTDVADESQGGYFDLVSFTSTNDSTALKNLVSGNNYAVVWRGHDDNNDGKIYAEFNSTNPVEGESYFGPTFAALVLEKAATPSVKPDLSPTSIKPYHFEWWEQYNVPKGDPWFNLTNYVNVTVKNNGSGSAAGFKVKLYADNELLGEKTISGLAPGSSTEEKFEWKPTGKDPMSWVDTTQGSKVTYVATDRTYVLKAAVDDVNEVPEENEVNNNLTQSQKVVWNGYTGDQPLQNYIQGSVKGGMLYTTGNGAYQGVGSPGTKYGTNYNASYNLEIPGTSKLTRLYIYYTWGQKPNLAPKIGVTLKTPSGTHTLSMDKGYNDYKGEFGIWRYMWGMYAYNISGYVTGSGNYSVSITNLNDGSDANFATEYAFAAPAILSVYENGSMPLRNYWINEGADLLLGGRRGDGGYLASWEAINNATFPGSVSPGSATLGIVTPWADYATDDEVYFNDHSLGRGIYCGYNDVCTQENGGLRMTLGTGTQVSINATDVTSYLATGSNRLTQVDDGDNMMPVNAFLLVNAAEGAPDFSISVSPSSASVTRGGSTNATVTLTSILVYDKNVTLGASGMPLNTTISFTPERGKPTYTSAMNVKTDNSTPVGSYPITITGTSDDAKVHSTVFTLKVTTTTGGGANASVSLRTNIMPAIAIEVSPSSIDFGELSPGETSGGSILTVRNRGGYSINVSAEVTDSAENLFVDGALLNDKLWDLYSAVIPKSGDNKPVAKLHVPENYAGAGSKEGTMMFWAKKS